jgi:hypothetical protein
MTVGIGDGGGYGAMNWRRSDDPEDAMNGPRYHTGRLCTEPGCHEPAGTAWGPHRCQRHNAEQLARMSRALAELSARVR